MVTLTVDQLLEICSLSLATIGGLVVILQWRYSIKIRHAEYIHSITEKLRTDEDISDVIYMLDYSEHWYDEDFHNSKDTEKMFDRAFSFFSYICYLRLNKHITKKDFRFFEYEIMRVARNADAVSYLYNLYHFSASNGCPMSFSYLLEFCKPNLPKDFFDPRSTLFVRHLNF